VIVHQWIDSGIGDTFWSQATAAVVTAAGTDIRLGTTSPIQARWNFAMVEIVP